MAETRAPVGDPKIRQPVGNEPTSNRIPPTANTILVVNYPCGESVRGTLIPGGPVEAFVTLKPTTTYEPQECIGDLDLKKILGRPVGPQIVPHWRKVRSDRCVVAAFLPHRVAGDMMPAEAARDELGLIEALKITPVASETALERLRFVKDASPGEIAEAANDAASEYSRSLQRVRREQLTRLDAEIKRIQRNYERDEQDGVPEHKLNADADYRMVAQLKFEAERLAALLSVQETSPETNPETEENHD